jgi:hypothetical protein
MKLHTLIIASAATATAFAGQVTSAPVSSDNNSYVGVSGLYNEFSGGLNAEGFRLDAGFGLGNGLSLDGRFENAYLDLAGSSQEAKFNELRALAHYTTQLNDGVSLIGGLGYGDMGFSSGGVDYLATEGLLADIGIQAQSGQYTASLTYTHLFALHASTFSFGPSDRGVTRLSGERECFRHPFRTNSSSWRYRSRERIERYCRCALQLLILPDQY